MSVDTPWTPLEGDVRGLTDPQTGSCWHVVPLRQQILTGCPPGTAVGRGTQQGTGRQSACLVFPRREPTGGALSEANGVAPR